jgi:tetratricopeptide (TPR) repeat protein
MTSTFLSRFTPSLMNAEALEAIFVQREELAQRILRKVQEGAVTPGGHATLLIGPRGIGKTHLISLLYHRLKSTPGLNEKIVIAWLKEEEWGVTSVLDFLLRILRSITGSQEDKGWKSRIEALYGLPLERAQTEAEGMLRQTAGTRRVLVLAENLDDLFRGLGEPGQFRLRAYFRENPFCAILATAQSPIPGLSRSNSPFYDFFETEVLEGLSLEDATLLLSKLAAYANNRDLAAFLPTAAGRARVRALNYLAGGNHRAYVIFSEFIARESLEEMIEPLARTIDDLTPYYQSRMATLSPEQRKILEAMCDRRSPASVAEVQQRCFLTRGNAAQQLEGLHEIGYLRALALGREKYYELREPLMRLAIEVKEHHEEPIRLLVEFLRLWYSPAELKQRLAGLPREAALERKYVLPALENARPGHEDPRISGCCRDYGEAVEAGDPERALRAVEELTVIRGNAQDWLAHAYCLASAGHAAEAVASCNTSIQLNDRDPATWILKGAVLQQVGQTESALASCGRAIELDPRTEQPHVTRGDILLATGRPDDALASYTTALQLNPADGTAQVGCGIALSDLGRYEEALSFLAGAIKVEPESARARVYEGAALLELKRFEQALQSAETAVRLASRDPVGRVIQGTALCEMGRHAAALEAFSCAIELGESSSYVRFKMAELLLALKRWRKACGVLDSALAQFSRGENLDAGNTASMIRNIADLVGDQPRLRLCIRMLMLVYRKHRSLPALAHGLVESISMLAGWAPPDARCWCDLWREEAEDVSEFRLVLRLLDASIRFVETKDLRGLLELPLEERLILEPLLGVRALETA